MWTSQPQVLLGFDCPAAVYRWGLTAVHMTERSITFLSAPGEMTNCSSLQSQGPGLCYRKEDVAGKAQMSGRSLRGFLDGQHFHCGASIPLPLLPPFLQNTSPFSYQPAYFCCLIFLYFSMEHCVALTGKSKGLIDTLFLPHYKRN